MHSVVVLDDAFEFDGRRYRSLTQIAREITGAHWSGPRFFGLMKRRAASSELGRCANTCDRRRRGIERFRATEASRVGDRRADLRSVAQTGQTLDHCGRRAKESADG